MCSHEGEAYAVNLRELTSQSVPSSLSNTKLRGSRLDVHECASPAQHYVEGMRPGAYPKPYPSSHLPWQSPSAFTQQTPTMYFPWASTILGTGVRRETDIPVLPHEPSVLPRNHSLQLTIHLECAHLWRRRHFCDPWGSQSRPPGLCLSRQALMWIPQVSGMTLDTVKQDCGSYSMSLCSPAKATNTTGHRCCQMTHLTDLSRVLPHRGLRGH